MSLAARPRNFYPPSAAFPKELDKKWDKFCLENGLFTAARFGNSPFFVNFSDFFSVRKIGARVKPPQVSRKIKVVARFCVKTTLRVISSERNVAEAQVFRK